MKLDEKDVKIIMCLQENCRTTLTELAKQTTLSIDSVKKRVKKLIDNYIFYPTVEIKPRNMGYDHIVDIKISFNTHSEDKKIKFIDYLKKIPQVTEIFSVSGQWDLSIVIISKNADDLGNITSKIQNKYGEIIDKWIVSTTLKAYKFEKYDLYELLNMKER